MQKRAGLLYLAKSTGRILLILENGKWSVPTVAIDGTVLTSISTVFAECRHGKILPIELYISADSGFEFSTFACVVEEEFLPTLTTTVAWANLNNLPTQLHAGIKNTLSNNCTKQKIKTILEN